MKIFERTRRKADLNLSINAIVVLILAITMLGLGLGFIRTMFKGATGKLAGAIETTSLKNPADSNTPLTVDRQITLAAGKPERIEVGYYNIGTSRVGTVELSLAGGVCSGKAPTAAQPGVITATGELTVDLLAIGSDPVDPGMDIGFNVILEVKGTAPKGTYICKLVATAKSAGASPVEVSESSQQKQFFLEVV